MIAKFLRPVALSLILYVSHARTFSLVNGYAAPIHTYKILEHHDDVGTGSVLCAGSKAPPQGIATKTTDLEMRSLWNYSTQEENEEYAPARSLLAMAVDIKQKETVNKIVEKFLASDFVVMFFHYDGFVDDWKDLPCRDRAIHVSALKQTKWWFAKYFMHSDILAEYEYIFLWDEDLGVKDFDPKRYISIVKDDGEALG